MRATHWALVIALSCMGTSASRAQDDMAAGEVKTFTVTANFQAQATIAASANVEDMTQTISKLQTSLSDVVSKQCDLLAAAFKAACAIEQLNMNSNIEGRRRAGASDMGGAPKRIWASVMATFAITAAPQTKATP